MEEGQWIWWKWNCWFMPSPHHFAIYWEHYFWLIGTNMKTNKFQLGIYICTLSNDFLTLGVLLAQGPWIGDFGGIVIPSWMLFWASSKFRQQWCKDFIPNVLILIGRKLMAKKNNQITNLINVNVLPHNYGGRSYGRSSMNRGPTISNVFGQQRTSIQ